MKHLLLLFFAFISFNMIAQRTGQVVVYSNSGEKFYVVLNGVRQNINPETNVKVTGLTSEWYGCKIISANNSFELEKNIAVKMDTLVTYQITGKKGKYKLRFFSETPLKDVTANSSQTVVNYSPTANTTTTGTTGGTTTTTTTGTNTGNTGVTTTVGTTGTTSGTTGVTTTVGTTGTTTETTGVTTTVGTTGSTGNGTTTESVNININVSENGVQMNMSGTTTGTGTESVNTSTQVGGNGTMTTTTSSSGTTGSNGTTTHYEETTTTTTSTTTTTNNGGNTLYTDPDMTVVITTNGNTGSTTGTTNTTTTTGNSTYTGGSCYMSDTDFAALKKSISAESFADDQLRVANMAANSKCMSVAQIKEIMQLFAHSDDQLTFAKTAYTNCTNKADYYLLMEVLTFSEDKQELENFINANK